MWLDPLTNTPVLFSRLEGLHRRVAGAHLLDSERVLKTFPHFVVTSILLNVRVAFATENTNERTVVLWYHNWGGHLALWGLPVTPGTGRACSEESRQRHQDRSPRASPLSVMSKGRTSPSAHMLQRAGILESARQWENGLPKASQGSQALRRQRHHHKGQTPTQDRRDAGRGQDTEPGEEVGGDVDKWDPHPWQVGQKVVQPPWKTSSGSSKVKHAVSHHSTYSVSTWGN